MTFRFLEFELDTEARELRRAGAHVALEPKVFDLLQHLVRNADRVVARDEVLRVVWPRVRVTHASIDRAVRSLRRALGDPARAPRVIRTLPARGFRFVAALREPAAPSRAPAYVGRAAVLERLRSALAAAGRGEGRVVLLSGEAGIGKTRTATEVLAWARSQGLAVASAACRTDGGSAPSPWSELARALELPEAPPAASDRAARFAATWAGFEQASDARPVALLLDDLHDADEDAVALLAFAAHGLRRVPVLLLATVRLGELSNRPAVARSFERLRRAPNVDELELGPLTPREVAELLTALTGGAPSESVAAQVAERVGGNPLFLVEALRDRDAAPPKTPADWEQMLSEGLARVIGRRIAALDPRAAHVLRAAATLGGDIDASFLARVLATSEAELAGALDEALAAGLLARNPLPGFAHPSFRTALASQLPDAERAALHLRAARELQRLASEEGGARIAHHLLAAGSAGAPAEAIELALRAGARAEREHAYARAAATYERATELLGAAAASDDTAAVLWTRLAEVRRRGGLAGAEAAGARALELSRRGSEPARLAEAALAFAGVMDRHRLPRAELVAALEEALARLGPDERRLRVRLLSRLAAEHSFAPDRERASALRAEAIALARSAGNVELEALVADTPFGGIWEQLAPEQRLALADRTIEHARAIGRRGLRLQGRLLRVGELFARGDLAAVARELDEAETEAIPVHALATLFKTGLYRTTLALVAGEPDRSEELAHRAHALGQRLAIDGLAFLGTQRVMAAVARGQASEALEPLARAAAEVPGPASRALYAWALAEAGERARCAALLEEIARRDLAELARFLFATSNAALLARACALADVREPVAALEAVLAPAEGRIAVRGLATAHGPVSFALALCAALRGDRPRARKLIEDTRAQVSTAGAALWRDEVERYERALGLR